MGWRMDYDKQVLGFLIILSRSDRAKFNEEFNNRTISSLSSLLPKISLEALRSFLKNNPEVCSQIRIGRICNENIYQQPAILLLYYAFYLEGVSLLPKLSPDLREFCELNFKHEILQSGVGLNESESSGFFAIIKNILNGLKGFLPED